MPHRSTLHPGRSVRGRLLLITAAVFLPAALLTIWLIRQDYRNQREATGRRLQESARALSLLVDASLRERETLLRGLAISWQLQVGDYAAFRALAASVMRDREGWIVLIDPENRQQVNTNQTPEVALPVVEVSEDLHRAMAAGEPYYSNFAVGAMSGRPMLFVAIPVDRPEGRHILTYSVPPDALSETLLSNGIAEGSLITLVDRQATVAARSRSPERYIGAKASDAMTTRISAASEGVAETVSLDGVASLTAFSRSAQTGWTVIIAAPRGEVFASARAALLVALAVALATAVGAIATALGVGGAIVRSVQRLVAATQALGRGEAVAPRPTGIVEIDFVSRALADTSRELAERQTALARARDTALAASRAKDEFLAALSHELRTPLNPVLLLATDAAADPRHSPAAREIFATIAKNVMLEARLIDDLLDLTRITRGKMLLERRPVDIHEVIRDAVATVQGELLGKQQSLRLELEARESVVVGDATRLQQVLWNLLNNAIKFTPAAGSIIVRSRSGDGHVVVEVVDSGIGITEIEMQRIFAPFSQGDHAANEGAHRFGGLGLGLAITRRLIESHSGEIAARSGGRDAGSTFVVKLPLALDQHVAEPAHGTTETVPPATRASRGTVLLVEDHEATRSAIATLLQRRGYQVMAAATSAEARALAADQAFTFVVSDIGLPDGDGYRLMQHLRESHGLKGIALSGYGMDDDIERGRAAGFLTYLTKPVSVQTLEEALARLPAGAAPL